MLLRELMDAVYFAWQAAPAGSMQAKALHAAYTEVQKAVIAMRNGL